MEGGGVMGIFRRDKPKQVAAKGRYRGSTWRDTGMTDALVLQRETLRRKYARDPLAQQLISAVTGPAYTMLRRNARTLSAQTLRLYRNSGGTGGVERGRSVGKQRREMLVKSSGRKVANMVDGATDLIEVLNHPALDLIESPNPYYPGTELEEMNFFFKMLVGDAYQNTTLEKPGVYYLWPMYPQFTTVNYSKTDLIESYYFGRDSTSIIELTPEEVLHYRNGLDKNNPLRGQSDLAHVMPAADIITAVSIADLAFAQAGYSPDHVFGLRDESTDDQMGDLDEEIESWWRSRTKSRLPFLARGITNVWPLNTPPKDLRTPEQIEMYLKYIRQALGWTESMSDSNDSTYAGGKIAEGQYGRYIADKLNEDAAQKTVFFGDMFGFDPSEYFFAYDDPISRNEGEIEERQIRLVSGGLLTPNEARKALGFEQVKDEAADRLVAIGATSDPFAGLFGGNKPVSDAGVSQSETLGQSSPPAPQVDEGKGADRAPDPDSIIKAAMLGEHERWTDGECCCGTKAADDFGPNPILREIARRFLTPLQQAALGIVTDAQSESVDAYAAGRQPSFDRMRAAATQDLSDALRPLVELSMRSAMDQRTGLPEDAFSVIPERAIRFLDTHVPQLADDIFETTSEIARRAVQSGLESGATVREIADAIEGVPAYRAERIARTELSNASHEGMIEGWKEAGVELVEWVTAPGPSAAHAMIAQRAPRAPGAVWVKAGETLGKETFKTDVRKPPARPNCRCGLIPILGEVE